MSGDSRIGLAPVAGVLLCAAPEAVIAQATDPPRLRRHRSPGASRSTGYGTRRHWASAERADILLQADPAEGAPATARTVVRVLASAKAIVVGIVCEDPDPAKIVSFSVRPDAPLTSEDHVRVVFGPFLDGRSGYVFAVNPSGARYDGLINPGGESDNPDWDGIWEAATARTASGWSVELWIPVCFTLQQTLMSCGGISILNGRRPASATSLMWRTVRERREITE